MICGEPNKWEITHVLSCEILCNMVSCTVKPQMQQSRVFLVCHASLHNLQLSYGPFFRAVAGIRAILCKWKPPCRRIAGSHLRFGGTGHWITGVLGWLFRSTLHILLIIFSWKQCSDKRSFLWGWHSLYRILALDTVNSIK